ncbi:MAG: LPS assembly protein LptD, partial [SAR86 cluster bacterium]|nr:LPS assembly protein LptD [SAR86 cluster bacterium]
MLNNTILNILIASSIYLLCIGNISAVQEPIKVESIDAESVSTDEFGDLKLSGNVYIKTNYLEFWSQKATYNSQNQSFILEGEVKALSKNLSIDASKLMANLSNQTFFLSKTSYTLLEKTFGEADEFSVLSSGNVELLNTSFNNCSKDDPVWEVSAKKITLLSDEQNVIIRDIKLKIGKVPVFYFPYLRAAAGKERLSGFLTPSIRQGKDGLDISLPYYFNIAANQDLTLAPRYVEERGSGLGLSYRYLSNTNEGEISLSGLSKDRKYKKETGNESSRWRGSWTQSSNINNQIFSEIKYEDASDEFYFRDVNDDLIGSSRKDYLRRSVNVWWKSPKVKLGLSLKESQSLNPFSLEDYKSLPVISLSSFTKRKDFLFLFSSNYGIFEQQGVNNLSQRPKSIKRAFYQPELRYKKKFNSSDFTFSLGSQETVYRVDNKKIKRSAPWVEIEYKVYLEKNNNEFYSLLTPIIKYINVKDNLHALSPQIDTRQRSQSFQNLYKRNWFSGGDMMSDRNRLILGLEHFTSSRRSIYNNYFSLGRAFLKGQDYPFDNSIDMNKSTLVGEFKSFLNDKTWLTGMVEWNST